MKIWPALGFEEYIMMSIKKDNQEKNVSTINYGDFERIYVNGLIKLYSL